MTMQRVMNTPRTVEIDITNRCNLRCDYCYHFTSEGDVKSDLPTEDWLTFFKELGQCAVMDVTLCGGEPFIRQDIQELIEGIIRNNMRYSLLSNGTLITEDHAAFLAERGRCNQVQISIDGSSPEVHESCRGKGTFFKAVRSIRLLQKYHIPVAVRVTIHHHNVHDLSNITRFLLEDLHLPSFTTNSASYLGLCRSHLGVVALTIEDRIFAMKTLISLNEQYQGKIDAAAGPLAEVCMWQTMMRDNQEGKASLDDSGGCLSSCGGVFSKLGVRADGVYIPCILLPGIELGRINVDNLKNIWIFHPELQKLRERRHIPLKKFTPCKDCKYIQYCRGGCPGLSMTYTGNAYQPSPDMCLTQFLRDGGSVPEYGVR
jgi:SynChlorMet cassette radical SAM/SPASM protein ScmE